MLPVGGISPEQTFWGKGSHALKESSSHLPHGFHSIWQFPAQTSRNRHSTSSLQRESQVVLNLWVLEKQVFHMDCY